MKGTAEFDQICRLQKQQQHKVIAYWQIQILEIQIYKYNYKYKYKYNSKYKYIASTSNSTRSQIRAEENMRM